MPSNAFSNMIHAEMLVSFLTAFSISYFTDDFFFTVIGRFQVGQNLYIKMSTAPIQMTNWTEAIKSWYDEVNFVSSDHVASFQ